MPFGSYTAYYGSDKILAGGLAGAIPLPRPDYINASSSKKLPSDYYTKQTPQGVPRDFNPKS